MRKKYHCQVPSRAAETTVPFQECHCRQVRGKASSLIQQDFHSAVTSYAAVCICCLTLVNKQSAGGVIALFKCSCFNLTLHSSTLLFFLADNVILCLGTICAQWMPRCSDTFSLLSACSRLLSVHHRRDPDNPGCSFTTTISDARFTTVQEQCLYTG